MKTKILIVLCVFMTTFCGINTSRAEDKSLDVIGDVVLARPGCFLATIFGTAVFVVALPFAAASGSVKATANTLVVHPAQATFTRPLGDFTGMP